MILERKTLKLTMNQYKQYKCTSANCSHVTNELDNILQHVNISHTNEPVFNHMCMNRLPSKCNRRFLTYHGLEKHMRQYHPEAVDLTIRKTIKCDLCELMPSSVKELKLHYISHWVNTLEPIKCIFDNCAYQTKQNETDPQKIKRAWIYHCSDYHPSAQYQTEGYIVFYKFINLM